MLCPIGILFQNLLETYSPKWESELWNVIFRKELLNVMHKTILENHHFKLKKKKKTNGRDFFRIFLFL